MNPINDNGFLVVGHDHIGHGESVVSKDEWGYFAEHHSDTVVADMHTLREMTHASSPGVYAYLQPPYRCDALQNIPIHP